MFDGKTRVVSVNWNDNLLVIFGAKLSFKYQSLSIVSVGGVDTKHVPRFDVFTQT